MWNWKKKLPKEQEGYFFTIANLDKAYSLCLFFSKREWDSYKKIPGTSQNIKPELYLYNANTKVLTVFNFNGPSTLHISYNKGHHSVYGDFVVNNLDTVIFFTEELKPVRSLIFSDSFINDVSTTKSNNTLLFIQDFYCVNGKQSWINYDVEKDILFDASVLTLNKVEDFEKQKVTKNLQTNFKLENCDRNSLFRIQIRSGKYCF